MNKDAEFHREHQKSRNVTIEKVAYRVGSDAQNLRKHEF